MKPFTHYLKDTNGTQEDETLSRGMVEGLNSTPKYIPSKYLYDEKGSLLFEQITELPEYYQTRTEASILRMYAKDLGLYFDCSTTLVELGSGSSTKTRILLNSMDQIKAYIPIDISEELLTHTIYQLNEDYPEMEVLGVSADYTQSFTMPIFQTKQKVFFFPGSTIGNFEPEEAAVFLLHIRSLMSTGDRLIIGMDRKKKRSVIEAAYNDEAGVTAAFNKNLLTRLNREMEGTMNEEAFSHVSFYNEEEGRIEMHLKSEENQMVKVNGEDVYFAKEETIHTENSYKFNLEDIQLLSDKSGFTLKQVFSDEQEYFSICVLEVPNT